MTERRAAKALAGLGLGLGLLAGALLVVPGSSAAPTAMTLQGSGSTTIAIGSPVAAGGPSGQAGQAGSGSASDVAAIGDGSGSASGATSPDVAGKGVPDSSHRPPTTDSEHSFWVRVGDVDGLYPGSRSRLPVTFYNPQSVRISVRTATTTAVGPASCPADAYLLLRTRTFEHRALIPPRGSRSKTLRFGMRKSAPDGCQNAVFRVTVTATAVRG